MKGKVVMLGGAGAMASSTAYDLHKTSDFEEIVIADNNEEDSQKLIDLMDGDKRFSYVYVDAAKKEDIVRVLKDAQYVVNGLPYHYELNFLEAVGEVGGIKGTDLNGFDFDRIFALSPELAKKDCAIFFANGGVATTCAMGMMGCEEFDEVDDVNVYWGMWRPITHVTFGLAETITYEHDPKVDERVQWVNGKLIRNLPPFALPKDWEFPEPIGKQETYVLTHTEPVTFWMAPIAKEKKVKRVTARGIWHHSWTRFERVLLETGIFEAEPIEVNGVKVSPFEVVMRTLERESKEDWKDPYEIAEEIGWEPQVCLSVEVIGYKKGKGHRVVYHMLSPYPFFDGKPVTAMMEYGCYVGTPMSITLQMMAKGEITTKGVFSIEQSGLKPQYYLEELQKRGYRLLQKRFSKGGISEEKVNIPTSTRAYRAMAWEE